MSEQKSQSHKIESTRESPPQVAPQSNPPPTPPADPTQETQTRPEQPENASGEVQPEKGGTDSQIEEVKLKEAGAAKPKRERSESPEEHAVIKRFKRMKANRRKKRTPEEYRETVMTLQERLAAAIKADRERVMEGKFGGEKLKLMPKLVEKLANQTLCTQFLNMRGLDLMGEMVYKFPNGEYPSANTRNQVLKMVRKMPVEREHILKTKFGGFLTFLEKRKGEIEENKKLASEIKRKWTRIVLDEHIDYTMLQNEQHDLTQAYLKKRTMAESLHGNSRKKKKGAMESDEEVKDGLQQRKNFRRTSYNFIVMPKNTKMSKNLKRLREGQRFNKKKAKKGRNKHKSQEHEADQQGLDVDDPQGLDVGDS